MDACARGVRLHVSAFFSRLCIDLIRGLYTVVGGLIYVLTCPCVLFLFLFSIVIFFISCDLLYSHNLWYVYAGTELYIYYFKLTRKNIIKISKLPIDLNSVSKEKIKSYVCIQTRRLEARETSLRANESTRISWPISAQIGEIRQPITAPHFVNNI